MINFYKYHTGVLDKQDIYRHPLSTMRYITDGNSRTDYTSIINIIKKDPFYAYRYAKAHIKGRWTEAEPYIMKQPECAVNYARFIIDDRWIEAEPYIMKDEFTWQIYRTWFNDEFIQAL